MNYKKITRDEEHKFPRFNSHTEAREYFKSKYGHSFQMIDSDIIDGEKIYFYNLILDLDAHTKAIEEMGKKGLPLVLEGDGTDTCLAFRYMNSYQKIEILETGAIHILY